MAKRGIPGVSFSAKRALGVTSAKRKIAKATGVPTTKSGRQRKVASAAGCSTVIFAILAIVAIFIVI